ncbi:MAG: 4Fe-4S dicluster domain-containing protein [Bacteroidales bacterium]|nr:4Fe-4S dicluster domain-containing protein [Bacteroidales bacterium]MBN2755670.1 4Fe-4S dicluster domain-containing protein [Bacteroidales bacterium]
MQQENNFSESRRDFIKNLFIGGGVTLALGNLSFTFFDSEKGIEKKVIICDFSKCTGCRTCETSCVAYNFATQDGFETYGIVNPKNANIRVNKFNPDLDIPATCAGCPDTPCINACPINVDRKTGEKALYLNKLTGAISVNVEECIGCGKCAKACETERVGVIRQNQESGKPEGLCTYCDGDPSCVKNCPYGALSYVKVDTNYEFFGKSPEQIAGILTERYYK